MTGAARPGPVAVVPVPLEEAGRLADLGDDAWRVVVPGRVVAPPELAEAVGGVEAATTDPDAATLVAYRMLQCGARLEAADPAPPAWPWAGPMAAPPVAGDRHGRWALAHDLPAPDLRAVAYRRWRVPAVAVVLTTSGGAAGDDEAAERLLAGSWGDLVLVLRGPGAGGLAERLDDPRVVAAVPAWTPIVVRCASEEAPDADGLRCLVGRLDRDHLDAVRLVLGEGPGPLAVRVASVARARVARGARPGAAAALDDAVGADPHELFDRLPRTWLVAGTAVGWTRGPAPGDPRWSPHTWVHAAAGGSEHDHALLLEADAQLAALEERVARLGRERDAARAEAARWRAQLRAWRPRGVRDWGRTVKAYARSLRHSIGRGGS